MSYLNFGIGAIMIDIPIKLDILNPEIYTQVSKQIIKVIHERDHFTCRCCGLRSTKYQQILFQGNNWRDLNNIATVCIFCQQCFSLDKVALMRSGVLVTLPEIKQAELNRLAIEIYVARITQEKNPEATKCLDFLMRTRETTRKELGTDDPRELGQNLHNCNTDAEGGVAIYEKLESVRLFPLDRRIIQEGNLEFNQFPQILAFWRSKRGPYPHKGTEPLQRLEQFIQTYL